MDSENIKKMHDIIDAGLGDAGRNAFILECLQDGRRLYNTDRMYIERQTQRLQQKMEQLKPPRKKAGTNTASLVSDQEIDRILEQQNMAGAGKKDISKHATAKQSVTSKIRGLFKN